MDKTNHIAQIRNKALTEDVQNLFQGQFFEQLIPNLVEIGFIIGVIVFLFIMIIGAIGWITSAGDKASIEQARGRIVNALIGIVILFSIFAIIAIVENVFGITILDLDLDILKLSQPAAPAQPGAPVPVIIQPPNR